MNRSDKGLVISLFIISIVFIIILVLIPKEKGKFAVVTYQNKEVMTIDLKKDATYHVDAKNGDVKLVVTDGSIQVASENSPYHLCQKQGNIKASHEVLVCLPNELVVTITGDKELDTTIK